MGEFFQTFKRDPLLGPAIHHKPWVRPRRRPWPWEALCWAITSQLIQASRAAEIQRRIVRRWGSAHLPADHPPPKRRRGLWPLRDVPSAAVIAGRAPAELASMDLSQGRSVAMVHCAREVARGTGRPLRPRRPTGGCWRSRRSARGRCSASGCTAVASRTRCRPATWPTSSWSGTSTGLGRRATVEEVEEYFAPYAPFRGLAGSLRPGGLAQGDGRRASGPDGRLGQQLVGEHVARPRGGRDQVVLGHPARRTRATGRGP